MSRLTTDELLDLMADTAIECQANGDYIDQDVEKFKTEARLGLAEEPNIEKWLHRMADVIWQRGFDAAKGVK